MSESNDYAQFCEDRTTQHNEHATQRVLSNNHDQVGLSGEFAFGEFCGIFPDTKLRPEGDKGVDFTVPLAFTVDVKTARKPYNLIHEEGKPMADIYVLAGYNEETRKATLIGWEFGATLAKKPVKEFGHGVRNHFIPAKELRPMDDLKARLAR